MAVSEVSETRSRADAILDAALALFARRGYHGTNVPTIAEQAGVGVGTVYRHFGDKAGLANAVYKAQFQSVFRVFGHLRTDIPARESHERMFFALSQWCLDHPDAVRFIAIHEHGDYLDDESRACKRQLIDFAYAHLDDLRKRRIVKDMPAPVLGTITWGVVLELFRAQLEGKLTMDETTIAQAELLCWEAVRL